MSAKNVSIVSRGMRCLALGFASGFSPSTRTNAFLAGFVLSSASVFAASNVERVVASVQELRGQGVEFKRASHQTPGGSATVDVTIGKERGSAVYRSVELIVQAREIANSDLRELDALPVSEQKLTRQSKTTSRHPNFIVLGREVPRAYLVFEFGATTSADPARVKRYLLPISSIEEEEIEEAP